MFFTGLPLWMKRIARSSRANIHPSEITNNPKWKPRVESLEDRFLPSFIATGPFAVGSNPHGIVSGDLNGDHRLDLVVANTGSNTISVLLGNGPATFLPAQTYATGGTSPNGVVIGDFNGDSIPDLVVTNTGSNDISVFLGSGGGAFQPAQVFNFGTNLQGPQGVAVGDFNQDHKLDLAVANFNGGTGSTLTILQGNGDGTFGFVSNITVGTGPIDVISANLANTGQSDLAVSNFGTNNVTVLLSNGNLTFSPPQSYNVGTGPANLAFGDINGDGIPDLVTTNSGNNTASVLLNTGIGTFQNAINFNTSSNPQGVVVGDFNKDKKGDIAIANAGSNSISVFLGNGDGTFQLPQDTTVGSLPISLAVGDYTDDGFPDLAVVNNADNSVTGLINQTTLFPNQTVYPAGTNPSSIVTGDFNRDNVQDIAYTNKGSNSISVRLGNRDGTFGNAVNYATDSGPTAIIVGDFTGDGISDLAVANSLANDVSIFQGNGDGSFKIAVNSGANADPVALAMGDFNGDGSMDLAVANFSSSTFSELLNNGNGTFHIFSATPTGNNPTSIVAADFNGNVIPDVAVCDFDGGVPTPNVNVYFGNGNGTFQAPLSFTAHAGPSSLAVGDFNHDNHPDLAVANASSNDVSILMNVGNGNFSPAVNFNAGPQAQSVAIGDFNHDGKQDLAVANFGNATASVLFGNGNGTFQPAVNYATGLNPISVAVGSFNGAQDLAVANFGSNTISILLNSFPGLLVTGADAGGGPDVRVFNAQSGQIVQEFYAYAPTFPGGVRVAMGDVNGGGVADIVTAPGPGGGPDIRVFDGTTGALIREFMAYSPVFTGGVYVAVGDINGDGFADIVTGADAGGGPHVEVWSGKDGSLLRSYYAYDPRFTGGVRVAVADVNGDGRPDIITAPGAGGGPDIRVWDGPSGTLFQEFYAYDPQYGQGVYVSAGDLNGDGHADIITGTGQGSSVGNVRVFSGVNSSILENFFPYPPGFNGGVRVGAIQDINGDGKMDIITGAGPSGGPHVIVFDGLTLSVLDQFFAYSSFFQGGVFVGGA